MKCACCSGLEYADCCEPFHKGDETAPTAEKLMRSRYSAFAVKAYDYLEKTIDPQTFEKFDHQGNRDWGDSVEFVGLEIVRAEEIKNKAVVEFKAHFRKDGIELVHHEVSKFRQQGGVWYFREGQVLSE
jgi:SEC-C motif-containing protein